MLSCVILEFLISIQYLEITDIDIYINIYYFIRYQRENFIKWLQHDNNTGLLCRGSQVSRTIVLNIKYHTSDTFLSFRLGLQKQSIY